MVRKVAVMMELVFELGSNVCDLKVTTLSFGILEMVDLMAVSWFVM